MMRGEKPHEETSSDEKTPPYNKATKEPKITTNRAEQKGPDYKKSETVRSPPREGLDANGRLKQVIGSETPQRR